MKNFFSLILIFIAAFAQAYAQTELPMIADSGKLRTYALNRATEVNVGIGSASAARYSYAANVWTGQKTQNEILAAIKTLKPSVDLFDTADVVSLFVSVANVEGNTVMYGYAEAKPVLVNGKWTLPASIGKVSLSLTDTPIKFDKQVESAVMLVKDNIGNTFFYDLRSYGQDVYYPPQDVAIKNAFLRVNFTDGTTLVYSPADGKQKPLSALDAALDTSFADAYSFKDPATVSLVVKSAKGVGVVPAIEVTMSVAGGTTIDITTSEGKRPVRIWWKPMSGTIWTSVTSSSTTAAWSIGNLPAGVNNLVPEWDPKDFAEAQKPVSNSNGKG